MSDDRRVVRHIIIHGRVQGVGYRAWAEDQAILRELDGLVRNHRDGTVEAVFAGPADAVAEMIEACRKGPPSAHVTNMVETDAGPALLTQRRPGEAFSLLPTA